jgi:integrase
MLSVRGKGNRLDRVPSPADLGRPLASYLRSGRPPGTAHRQVFLALGAPHGPLTAPAVESVTTRAMAGAGTTGPGAGHRLRHTAAWGSAGGGFAGAGKLLRHTSRRRPYARSDIAAQLPSQRYRYGFAGSRVGSWPSADAVAKAYVLDHRHVIDPSEDVSQPGHQRSSGS